MLGRLPSVLSVAGLAVAIAAGAAPAAFAAPDTASPGAYIVQLDQPPIGEYDGGTGGIPATSPRATGRAKVDARSMPATRYRAYLADRQSRALDRVDGARPTVTYSYRTAFAGFAATLTPEQAKELAKSPEVAGVWKSSTEVLTSADDDLGGDPANPALGGDGAAWLRLTAPSVLDNPVTGVPGAGLWNRIGGGPLAADGPGDGLVIGDLDSGISPHNASFAASPGTDNAYLGAPFGPRPSRFTGTCDPGNDSAFPGCTDKIVAARYYVHGLGVDTLHSTELPLSPRDNDGHGSHTAATAAGNYGVQPWAGGPRISGIAPRARIAAYKVCWQRYNGAAVRAYCSDADVVAAIDQAVADGVDVLNHSISASSGASSPKHRAFLGAYRAGVFVAASAGNNGPASRSLTATPSPWTTVVASSTMNRRFRGELTLSGTTELTVTGASMTSGFPAAPLVDAAAPTVQNPGGTDGLCLAGTLDPAAVAGKVVLCTRGISPLVDKSAAVKAAGGIGMVLGNPPTGVDTTLNVAHTVPSVHVDRAAYAQIKAALAAGPHDARMTPTRGGAATADGTTPRVAGDSSRGPVANFEDLPGPDVSAPGVDVLAAVAGTSEFALYSGTSMATPHVAGAALLLRQRHPAWRPEQIKSALATTANPDVKATTGDDRVSALDVGSGQIDPNRADDPGLVVTPSLASLEAFLDDPATTAGALNLPAIVSWNMVGRAETVRTFTSVDGASHDWTISTTAASGTAVTTSPAVGETVTVAPGASTDVTVTVQSTSNDGSGTPRTGGELRLTDEDGRTVRVPITVRPMPLRAPSTVSVRTEGPVGTRGLTVATGHSGDFSARIAGFTAATRSTRGLAPTDGHFLVPIDVPAGTSGLLAARLQNPSSVDADVDLELWTADANGNPVARVAMSGNVDSDEFVQLRAANGGRYVVKVISFDVPPGNGTIELLTWNTSAPTGDATLRLRGVPTGPVTAGDPIELCAIAESVGDDQYLGLVDYHASGDGSGPALGSTIVDVARGTPEGGCVSAPDTTIVSGPSDPSASDSATFDFGADQDDATFECRLDVAAFAACTSPHTVSGLADGRHAFEVRAVSAGGPDPTPAVHAWTVDRTAPAAPTITGAPATETTARTATLSWTGEPDGSYTCQRGSEAWTDCTSPTTYDGLPIGPQSFAVRQTDAAGNTGAPARAAWIVVAPQPPGRITPPGLLDPPSPVQPPAVALPPRSSPTATRASVRVPATIGARGRAIPVGCRVDRGSLTRCSVVARYRGRVVGRGAARFSGARSGEVTVRLSARGLAAIRRLGGARLRFRVTVTSGGRKLTATRSAAVRPARTILIPTGGLFASNSTRLTTAGRRLAARVRGDLAGAKRVTCVGHTDSHGLTAVNRKLGLERATAVCAALRGRGVPVRSRSAGESQPRATNRTAAGRSLNRRVEIIVSYR
jgi:outer membrane protein OmpA-like peptidoglycan-associated protein/subtilisin family serine protease